MGGVLSEEMRGGGVGEGVGTVFGGLKLSWPSNPYFFRYPCFFRFPLFLVFWCSFPFLLSVLGFRKEKNHYFFGGFPCFFVQKSKGWRVKGFHRRRDDNKNRICIFEGVWHWGQKRKSVQWETARQLKFESARSIVNNFVEVAQAPIPAK